MKTLIFSIFGLILISSISCTKSELVTPEEVKIDSTSSDSIMIEDWIESDTVYHVIEF